MKKIIKKLRRFFSAMTQPGSGGLLQPGDWRCVYPDGNTTKWMSYGDAANCRALWGGTLEWRFD